MADDPKRIKLSTTESLYQLEKLKHSSEGKPLLFKGLFNKKVPIALKRYPASDKESNEYKKHLELLSSPENRHPNFIRYFGHAEEKNEKDEKTIEFNYLAIEWCDCSVADIIDPSRKVALKTGKSPDVAMVSFLDNINHKEILRQSSEAVSFLHGLGHVHRNLHPDNFLIFFVDQNKERFLIKLTDFQLSKNLNTNKVSSGTMAQNGWVAPESFLGIEITYKMDAFIMGCYYYYVLSGGKHPFSDENKTPTPVATIMARICDQKCEVYQPSWNGGSDWNAAFPFTIIHGEEATWALDTIKDLIKFEASKRKSIEDVLLKSQYFQPQTYKIYDNSAGANRKPGLCVIVTQDTYHDPAMDLCWEDYSGKSYPGVNIDANNLSSTFSSFDYDILALKNLQAHEIVRYLSPNELLKMIIETREKNSAGPTSFKNYASLVVCFLGHGGQGVVYGVDGFPVSLNTIQYDAFDDNACSDLSGKPKIFIILACQGEKTQQEIQKSQHREASVLVPTFPMVSQTEISVKDGYRIPPVFDFVRLIATIEGYQAFGGWNKGSPFINSLCNALNYEYKEVLANSKHSVNEKEEFEKEENKILKKSLEKRDLTQLFTTFVTPLVGRTIQTPEFRSSLSKTIRFRRITIPRNIPKPAYNGAEEKAFKYAREYHCTSLGRKKRKLISDSDCTAMWYTIYEEAPDNDAVRKAIAWVILNRYNSNIKEWGGNKSLEDVCKYPGLDQFKFWKTANPNPAKFDRTTLDKIHGWLTCVYDESDPTKGATIFFLNNQKSRIIDDFEPTVIISDAYHFYKRSDDANKRPLHSQHSSTTDPKRPRQGDHN